MPCCSPSPALFPADKIKEILIAEYLKNKMQDVNLSENIDHIHKVHVHVEAHRRVLVKQSKETKNCISIEFWQLYPPS